MATIKATWTKFSDVACLYISISRRGLTPQPWRGLDRTGRADRESKKKHASILASGMQAPSPEEKAYNSLENSGSCQAMRKKEKRTTTCLSLSFSGHRFFLVPVHFLTSGKGQRDGLLTRRKNRTPLHLLLHEWQSGKHSSLEIKQRKKKQKEKKQKKH